jgi:hypothetical protein|nr:MAG: hypothetical protein [Bacteriophage sp.]
MSATYNPVSKEKEEGNRLGYYYNEDNLPFTKVDYLNIKNPKIIDAYGRTWKYVEKDTDTNRIIKIYKSAVDKIKSATLQ